MNSGIFMSPLWQSMFVKIHFSSNTSRCPLTTPKFLARKGFACDSVSIDISNVGDKLSMTTNISRLIDLNGEFF
jgi:hypothetical protein